MKIPKQSKPVRRAGLKNRLKPKFANQVAQSTIDDVDVTDTDDEDLGEINELTDETYDTAEDNFDTPDNGDE